MFVSSCKLVIQSKVLRFRQTKPIAFLSTKVQETIEEIGETLVERFTGADRGIAVLSLNRPKAKNALGDGLVNNLREATEILRNDHKLSVVIVRSSVKGIFCAGADLKERILKTNDEVAKFVHILRGTLTQVEDLPVPTIAAIDGVAVGGGLELALACDLRVASDDAKMGLVETVRGLIPGAGGTQRLPRTISVTLAKELIYTSRLLGGVQAKEIGLVNHVAFQNENGDAAYQRALTLAREILPNAPQALRMAKRAINEGISLPIKEGYNVEQKCYEIIIPTKDRQEGMLSFMEKRRPVYTGQ